MSDQLITIRPFQTADQEIVIKIWEACELTRPWNSPTKDIARKLTVQPDLFLVGETNNLIVATVMAGFEGHRGWINYLAVLPQYQGKGYGRLMMDAAEEKLLALGCPKINLQIRSTNTAVIDFYNAIGFKQDDVVSFGKRLIPDQ